MIHKDKIFIIIVICWGILNIYQLFTYPCRPYVYTFIVICILSILVLFKRCFRFNNWLNKRCK